MEDLLLEYKQTKAITSSKIDELKTEIKLLNEKIVFIKNPRKKQEIEKKITKLEDEKSIYSSCKSDLNYAIYWMEHGHSPGLTRGIERRAAYEREYSFDPLMMQRYFRSRQPEYPWETTDTESLVDTDEREVIELALQNLTEKEREIYLLFTGKCMTQYKIADMLFVTRNTVKTTLARAKRKIKSNIAKYKKLKGEIN